VEQLRQSKHQFAFYSIDFFEELVCKNSIFILNEQELVHRALRVIKLSKGDSFIIFNQAQHVELEIVSCTKKEITVLVLSCQKNNVFKRQITFLLPLLKKEALEAAVYSLTEIGVNVIQLVMTQKSRKAAISDREMKRLNKIIIAAAEQSKNYNFPVINQPVHLPVYLESISSTSQRVLFDELGKSFFEVKKSISENKLYLTVGPEGGLSDQELSLLQQHDFVVCSLTKTVLRSLQAVAIGSALFRL